MRVVLLVALLLFALVPLTSSQALIQNVIYNVQSVKGVFHSNVTNENYMVGCFQGDVYVWENTSPVLMGQGVIGSAGLEGNYVVIEGYVVVNGTPFLRMWILNVVNNREIEIPISTNYTLVGNVGDYLFLEYNSSSGSSVTALNMSTGKFVGVSVYLGQGKVGVEMLNSTADSANLLIWSVNGGIVQVSLEQLFVYSGTLLSGPPTALVSSPGKLIKVHGGLIIEGPQSYIITDSGKVLYVPGLTEVNSAWIDGNTALILNGSSLVIASSSVSMIPLPSPGQLAIPGPFNVTYVVSGDQTYVVRGSTLVSSITFSASSLLYESQGTAYLLSQGLEEINLFTGEVSSTPIQGNLVGFVPFQGGILLYTLVNDQVYVYSASSPGFTASITLNYPGYWVLELGNVEVNVTGTLVLTLPSGEYTFTVRPEPGYNVITGEISPTNSTLLLTPVKSLYTLLIVGFGAPYWSLEIDGHLVNSTGLVVLSESVGVYGFSVIPPEYYNYTVKVITGQLSQGKVTVTPSSNAVTLNGRTYRNVSLYVEINFTEERFPLRVESQIPFTLNLNGTPYNVTGNSTLYLYPGLYYVKVSPPNGYNVTYPLKVVVPLNSSLTVSFTKSENVTRNTLNLTRTTIPPSSNVSSLGENSTTQPAQILTISSFYVKVITLIIFLAVAIIIGLKVR
ncbi:MULTISPECIES: hypothetical protein [Metallosphaera]|uniref:Uncharacterized protein n=1 Tax=Metallosphaera prunae TaxID=47304 RepID=A0A4D8RY82_METPR|nr:MULTISPECIES: hypothetical protein [Metallosphaera]MCY0862149.1 hypothetical protein [Metallosphaera prunae]QCO29927.1 hypothetical protein DFR88_04960 [Metallosphaera prunae]BBL46324.1 hypothetical protein MJ1HA_0423 [Metallosphaera sedula]